MPTASSVLMMATIRLFRNRFGILRQLRRSPDPQDPLAAVVDALLLPGRRRVDLGRRPASCSCTRLVKSLMNDVISGSKKTVGGTVVARSRGLKAVEAIQ